MNAKKRLAMESLLGDASDGSDARFYLASTILVVDDDPEVRRHCRRLLSQTDITRRLWDCATGEQALARCGEEPPDCIVAAVMLPDMDGFQLLQRLTEQLGPDSVPVVMIAADTDESLAVRAMREGAQDYLMTASLNAHALNRAVRCAIERHAWSAMRRAAQDRKASASGRPPPTPDELSAPAAMVMAGVAELSQRIDVLIERLEALSKIGATDGHHSSTVDGAETVEDYLAHVFDENEALNRLDRMLSYSVSGVQIAAEKVRRLRRHGKRISH